MFDTAFTFSVEMFIKSGDPRMKALQIIHEAAGCSADTILLDTICMSSGGDAISSFAIREDLISSSFLQNSGLLKGEIPLDRAQMLRQAYAGFHPEVSFMVFAFQDWVRSMSLYHAFRMQAGDLPWMEWPPELRTQPTAQDVDLHAFQDEILYEAFVQMQLFLEWKEIRQAAYAENLKIIGRLPYASAADSVDAWSHQELFRIEQGSATAAYDWEALRSQGYEWWLNRIGYIGRIYDGVILEHFERMAECGGHGLMQALREPAGEIELYAVRDDSWTAQTAALAEEAGIHVEEPISGQR